MGEQAPMDTISAFVRAAWEKDAKIWNGGVQTPAEVWSKPDGKTGSLELRRITTRQSRPSKTFDRGVRPDFFELYWADLSGGSTLSQVENWIRGLLLRNPLKRVPPKLRLAWVVLWVVSLLIVYMAAAAFLKPENCVFGACPYGWVNRYAWTKQNWSWFSPVMAAIIAYAANNLLVPYFGRVVRYTRAQPDNIAARKAIRERGMALLDALHDGTYDRIIVVGHSLGSILGYDLINYYWASRPQSHTFLETDKDFPALREIEESVAELRANADAKTVARFHAAQKILRRALRTRAKPEKKPDGAIDPKEDTRWLITDFVTLGSPLTHSDFLLTSDMSGFRDKVDTRQYPVSPAVREDLDKENIAAANAAGFVLEKKHPRLMSFSYNDKGKICWQLHHAALFAAVAWTNLHDPARLIAFGDVISGPLGGAPFGHGVVDVNLKEKNHRQSSHFTHTEYWQLRPDGSSPPTVIALRDALDLTGDNL
jgi:hypothetical protein